MLLSYTDDSSESGYVLFSAVVVPDDRWLPMLDAWNDYRRWLRRNFGFRITKGTGRRVPVEIHGTDFATGAGEWRICNVGQASRIRSMKVGLRLIGRYSRVFAVCWDPTRIQPGSLPPPVKPAVACWEVLLERLASHSIYDHSGSRVMCTVDEGYGDQFTRVLRRMRRFHHVGSLYGGSLAAAAPMLVDDPIVRDSKTNVFVQMADLCAYAALRQMLPRPPHVQDLWTELGPGIHRPVNKYTKGQPPGIKLLPV